jgi:hypothetical protein
LHTRWAWALGIEDLGGLVVIASFDILRRLPAKLADWGLRVMDPVEDICARETSVASILSVSEVDDGRAGISDQSSMRTGDPG